MVRPLHPQHRKDAPTIGIAASCHNRKSAEPYSITMTRTGARRIPLGPAGSRAPTIRSAIRRPACRQEPRPRREEGSATRTSRTDRQSSDCELNGQGPDFPPSLRRFAAPKRETPGSGARRAPSRSGRSRRGGRVTSRARGRRSEGLVPWVDEQDIPEELAS